MSDTSIPRHIAIIMDGNGRWAKERGLPRRDGHRAGAESVRECVEACKELGVEYLTLYAFSSENWNRPAAEVTALMLLLERFLEEKAEELMKQNVRLRAIGHLDRLPAPPENGGVVIEARKIFVAQATRQRAAHDRAGQGDQIRRAILGCRENSVI